MQRCPEFATWARFVDLKTNDSIFSLEHSFRSCWRKKLEQIVWKLILSKIGELDHNGKVILMGDFNLEPATAPIQKIVNSDLKDAFATDLNLGPVGDL